MIDQIMICYLLIFCIVAAFTDWKRGKIYNKWISFGLGPGLVLVMIYYIQHNECIALYLINFVAAIAIAVLFYALKLWGAGDSKLWIFLNFMFPAGWYIMTDYMLFPSMLIFMIIFIEAYVYLLIESLWNCFLKRNKGIQFRKMKVNIEQIWNLIFSIAFLSALYTLGACILKEYYEDNRIFFALMGILLANQLTALQFRGKKCTTVVLMSGYIIYMVLNREYMDMQWFGITVLLVVVTHFSLKFAEKYNYAWVRTADVKEGMIMSYFAVQQFCSSRVKDLPLETDETTKSRITQRQADAIHRWEKSKYGKEYVMVVRYIPFAIFILIGLVTYLIWTWKIR